MPRSHVVRKTRKHMTWPWWRLANSTTFLVFFTFFEPCFHADFSQSSWRFLSKFHNSKIGKNIFKAEKLVDGFMQNSSTSRPARDSAQVRFSKYSEYSFQAQYAPQRDKGEYICLHSLLCKTRKKDGQKHNNNVMAISRTVMYIPATVLVKDPEGLPDVLLEVGLLQLLGHHWEKLVEVNLAVAVTVHLIRFTNQFHLFIFSPHDLFDQKKKWN